jgi:hypothetical protein
MRHVPDEAITRLRQLENEQIERWNQQLLKLWEEQEADQTQFTLLETRMEERVREGQVLSDLIQKSRENLSTWLNSPSQTPSSLQRMDNGTPKGARYIWALRACAALNKPTMEEINGWMYSQPGTKHISEITTTVTSAVRHFRLIVERRMKGGKFRYECTALGTSFLRLNPEWVRGDSRTHQTNRLAPLVLFQIRGEKFQMVRDDFLHADWGKPGYVRHYVGNGEESEPVEPGHRFWDFFQCDETKDDPESREAPSRPPCYGTYEVGPVCMQCSLQEVCRATTYENL